MSGDSELREQGFPPNSAAGLLDHWLVSRGRTPGPGLVAIFMAAERLSPARSFDRPAITTERILFALPEVYHLEATAEGVVINQYAIVLEEKQGFETLRESYFPHLPTDASEGVSDSPMTMTPAVEQVLEEASREAFLREPSEILTVDAVDFLSVFPPAGSVAAKLLERLGVRREILSKVVELARSEWRSAGSDDYARFRVQHTRAEGPEKATASASIRRRRKPRINERVFTHSDEPAVDDMLGRKPFAEVLAGRLREARAGAEDMPPAFVAHLHGPWGSGKSSVLNFLERKLSEGDDPWLVVRFDAWRSQRLQPPWWSLITTIYSTARKSLNWRKALKLRIRWLVWRIRADYVPWIAVGVCALALLFLLFWVGTPTPAANSAPRTGTEEQLANWLDKLLKLVAGVGAFVGAVVLWSRSLAMGSQRAAQAYADLKSDPYGPIAKLFNRLIEAIKQPVVVFVDDLDRCEGKYVVDLLEGIQTLMRGAAVTYVVAGDRKWICSSFEQRYGAFSPPIGEPGRPLGYLFLDKIFQISAAIPQPGSEAQLVYWNRLLDPERAQSRPEERRAAEAKAETEAGQLTRQEDLQKLVDDAEKSGDVNVIQATRAAAAKRIASQPAASETEHRLRRYVNMLEPNPRAMKRLINAYGMHQATLFLAGRSCPPDALARWTILELRWPLLADFLANRPACVARLHAPLGEDDLPQVPEQLRDLFGDELVMTVIGRNRGANRLSEGAIRAILGAAQGER